MTQWKECRKEFKEYTFHTERCSLLAFRRTSMLTYPLIAQTDKTATPDKELSVRFGKVIVRNPVRETSSLR